MTKEYIHKEIVDADGVTCYIKTGEIVRCKDCKHKPKEPKGPWVFGCDLEFPDDVCIFYCADDDYMSNMPPSDDFYCAYGERKDNG